MSNVIGRTPSRAADGAVGPFARGLNLSRLEAVLFLASEPLSSRKLAQFANLADGTEARTLVRRLNQLYDAAGSAFRVEEVGGGFHLLSRPNFASWLRRLHQSPVEVRLSGPAMETLAVVAYRQPVPRAEVEAIRGVQCGEMIRQLMERDLVKIGGRSDELGRPFLYCTTKHFLRIFGLRHLDELPRANSLRAESAGTATDKQAAGDQSPSLTRGLVLFDEESEVNVSVSAMATDPVAETEETLVQPGSGAGNLRAIDNVRAEIEDGEIEYEDELDDDDEDEDEDEDEELEDEEDDLEDDEWEEVDDEEFDDEEWEEDDDEGDDDEEWEEEEEEEWEEE